MPGILPMKVIKIGTNSQARIAQACDRCRSKKIRCDGIPPSCTQCINVGFECKTSDKLSRRAFPRGYTESLEERVRALEGENRELKTLLDEKDEKIDMLSRIHSYSPRPSQRRPSRTLPSPDSDSSGPEDREDVFKIVQSPNLVDDEETDAYFMGTSCNRLLIDSFKSKLQESANPSSDFKVRAFFPTSTHAADGTVKPQAVCFQAPARMISDQLVNIFFQEWMPLFPILHKPAFLHLYEEYFGCPEILEDKSQLAQLNLVFAIAAHSSDAPIQHDVESFTEQWQTALETILMDSTISTLQCLLLAVIASQQSGDHARVSKYKALAVSLSQRLGLHQSQKRFALGTLTLETRKRLFWTLYTLDCFTAAQLGLPRALRDDDVHCEYPIDTDDEYITEKGFLPTLPGEYTKVSSALALFKASRVLAKVLAELYPASTSYEISFRTVSALSDELDEWSKNIPTHLNMQFIQDKPSTNIISSRSPLVSLAYHYIKSLIYQPAVCAASAAGSMAGTAKVVLASCSKHIVQILQLLSERTLCFSLCLNKSELLVSSGFGFLFQNLDLEGGSTLMKENSRLTFIIANMLDRQTSPASVEFRRLSTALAMQHFTKISDEQRRRSRPLSRHSSDSSMQEGMSSAQRHIRSIMSRFGSTSNSERRATIPVLPSASINTSQTSLSSIHSEPAFRRSDSMQSSTMQTQIQNSKTKRSQSTATGSNPNLDYMPLEATITSAYSFAASVVTSGGKTATSAEWEHLLGSLDNGQTNMYDHVYGGPPVQVFNDFAPPPVDTNVVWSPGDMWSINNTNGTNTAVPQSVISFSDESLTSGGDEFPDLTQCASDENYGNIWMSEKNSATGDAFGASPFEGAFGL